ncbi:MAG: phosphoribosylformimino-5-aminoimidazole carboxamide ribotide isomerase [Desulfobulbus propionicus]|nr:MAG: phosphoribosylformimino-5-aminoimidazole carboxamide ribotide isomerase [Desulfobulbus propionicus]
MRFRPCLDLHDGRVKQIVGASLADAGPLTTNFISDLPPSHFAALYKADALLGGHVIMLGPGNEAAAEEALAAYPDGLQVGGGITLENCKDWLDCGASHVIVTSYVFHDGRLDRERLRRLSTCVGRERLVLDLSCRFQKDGYYVVTDRWQRFTQMQLSEAALANLARYCDEFLVHAVDVEGRSLGVDRALLELLAGILPLPTTYAGGVASMEDLETVERVGQGRIDVTVGSALDIFGGTGLAYQNVVTRYG